MQLGFVGLGKMGGNMVHRIHRDSDHQVVAFDFSADAVSAITTSLTVYPYCSLISFTSSSGSEPNA